METRRRRQRSTRLLTEIGNYPLTMLPAQVCDRGLFPEYTSFDWVNLGKSRSGVCPRRAAPRFPRFPAHLSSARGVHAQGKPPQTPVVLHYIIALLAPVIGKSIDVSGLEARATVKGCQLRGLTTYRHSVAALSIPARPALSDEEKCCLRQIVLTRWRSSGPRFRLKR